MKNGVWAKIISTPNRELDQHIKALTDLGYIVTVEKK